MVASAFAPPTVAPEAEIGLSLEDFIQRYDEAPFELIDGEFYEMSPQMPRSSIITLRLASLLLEFVEQHQLGIVLSETPFVLKASKKWVKGSRVPDVLFIQSERFQKLKESDPHWDLSPLPIIPDIAVEVMSPTDRLGNVLRKIKLYLTDGVQVCWVVDAERHAVLIYRAGSDQVTLLTEEDSLTEAALLPGLSIPIAKLFP